MKLDLKSYFAGLFLLTSSAIFAADSPRDTALEARAAGPEITTILTNPLHELLSAFASTNINVVYRETLGTLDFYTDAAAPIRQIGITSCIALLLAFAGDLPGAIIPAASMHCPGDPLCLRTLLAACLVAIMLKGVAISVEKYSHYYTISYPTYAGHEITLRLDNHGLTFYTSTESEHVAWGNITEVSLDEYPGLGIPKHIVIHHSDGEQRLITEASLELATLIANCTRTYNQ